MASTPSKKTAAKPTSMKTEQARRALYDLPLSTTTPMSPASAKTLKDLTADEEVLVMVPTAFTLTLDDQTPVALHAGVQNMKKSLAEHWYAKARGVVPFDPNVNKAV